MTSSTTTAESSAGVEPASGYCQTPGSPQYERLRTRYFNDKLPPNRPVEIATPTSSLQVCDTISRAASRGLKVGVRSGGHLFPACSLVDGGVLIDTGHLNRAVEYDAATKLAAFGPGVTVEEAERSLTSLGRFFPFGHHPSVGLGGFLLAGGQGWFTRGSGYTTDAWIERLEVVMPNAQLITASRQEHTDVFWAVRGSGQGCFGVVTKIWVRTVPARTLYDRTLMLDITDDYQQQLKSVLETCDLVPKQGTDIALVTHWSDIMDAGDHWETRTKRLVLSISLSAYADSIGEAKTMLSPFSSPQDNNAFHIIADMAVKETTWQNMWDMQNFLFPSTERWQIDSILTDRVVSYSELVRLSTQAMCDLPTRKSVGTICIMDYYPDEADQALSLPQHHYVSTMLHWKESTQDEAMKQWMLQAYYPLDEISVGQYVADFDADQRIRKVMTTSAMHKWLRIRQRWDPQEMFIGFRGFQRVLEPARL